MKFIDLCSTLIEESELKSFTVSCFTSEYVILVYENDGRPQRSLLSGPDYDHLTALAPVAMTEKEIEQHVRRMTELKISSSKIQATLNLKAGDVRRILKHKGTP